MDDIQRIFTTNGVSPRLSASRATRERELSIEVDALVGNVIASRRAVAIANADAESVSELGEVSRKAADKAASLCGLNGSIRGFGPLSSGAHGKIVQAESKVHYLLDILALIVNDHLALSDRHDRLVSAHKDALEALDPTWGGPCPAYSQDQHISAVVGSLGERETNGALAPPSNSRGPNDTDSSRSVVVSTISPSDDPSQSQTLAVALRMTNPYDSADPNAYGIN